MISITLKDGNVLQVEEGTSVIDVAKGISEGLGRMACAGEVNGNVVDLRFQINEDSTLNIFTFNDDEGKKAFRHTASHILAQAVKRLFPNTHLAIGPSTDTGFYYDFDREKPFSPEELDKIEGEMKKIIKENLDITTFTLPRDEALELCKDEPYKKELIEELPEDEIISFYKQGDFVDLCRGPHLLSTKTVKSIKLLSSSGAYWRGDEKNKMLQRIYGTAFTKNADLNKYLEEREEALKRDHNKLGRDLEFFTTSDLIGQGLPLLMPKGVSVINTLQRIVEDEEEKRGYVRTKTPFMAKSDLYKVSGHWDHYKDGMFILGDVEEKEETAYALRPMTCPFQFSIYNTKQHSYRDLPIRYGETSTLFRNESSGEMHGLIRVRQFTISEGHIVCRKDQLKEEFNGCVDLINYFMDMLDITGDISYMFSKWDPNNKEKYIGDPAQWEQVQGEMKELLDNMGIDYIEKEGEAAFYGPKLDILFKNVFGKEDTIITVQIDFSLAERFGMTYIDNDGKKVNPIILHRTSIGCYERTLAILIEKYAGSFPTWLAPTQVMLLPISDKYNDYTKKVYDILRENNIKVEVDYRAEKIGYKIREARNQRLPYVVVIGEQEEKDGSLSVRGREGDLGQINLNDFVNRILKEIKEKTKNYGYAKD